MPPGGARRSPGSCRGLGPMGAFRCAWRTSQLREAGPGGRVLSSGGSWPGVTSTGGGISLKLMRVVAALARKPRGLRPEAGAFRTSAANATAILAIARSHRGELMASVVGEAALWEALQIVAEIPARVAVVTHPHLARCPPIQCALRKRRGQWLSHQDVEVRER